MNIAMIRLRSLAALGYATASHGKQQIYTHNFVPASASSSTYMATTAWQRAAIAAVSAMGALANPARADLVAALGETTGAMAYQKMRQRMQVDPEGREVLRDRPRVTSQSVSHAWDMPAGTFGAAYAQFMGSRNFLANDRPPVRFLLNPELAFVAARAREVHDFWHVLFDLPTTVSGELLLKMVELVQTGLPMCGMSVVGGPLRLSANQRELLRTVHYPWAAKAGLNAADLMCIYYEKHLEEDLEELRQKWRITPATLKVSKF